jgi:SAM-dependent methyltransferase
VPVAGDAVRLPIADSTIDGVISVEAAFHFRSRQAFFGECYRVLRPGGALSISDIAIRRWPVSPGEVLAGLTQLRVFGLQRTMAMTPGQIAAAARAAGLAEVQVTTCGDRVIAPALRLTAQRLAKRDGRPGRAAGRRPAAPAAGRPAVAAPDHRLPAVARRPAVTSTTRAVISRDGCLVPRGLPSPSLR